MNARVRKAIRIVIGLPSLFAGVWFLFRLAGRWDWVAGWIYIGVFAFGQSAVGVVLWVRDPELLRRRGEKGKGTKGWDIALLALFTQAYLGELIVSALDVKHDWMQLPWWTIPIGIGLFTSSLVLIAWAMLVNTHFEKTVRIQTDRDHRVIDTGPYRLMRHPGYLATMGGFILAAPLMLRSGMAFAPAGVATAILIARTWLEDRLLQRELNGYAEYAARVPSRLVPFVW